MYGEIGGLALLLKLVFGGNYFSLAVIVLVAFLAVVWFLSFQAIERIFGLLGLFMLVFVSRHCISGRAGPKRRRA